MADSPDRGTLDRLTAVMIAVVALTLLGGFLLLSAAESLTLVDGAIEWQAESPLRAVVQLLCLNYQFPTIHAGDIKGYVLGVGTVVALAAMGISFIASAREKAAGADHAEPLTHRWHMPALVAGQLLAVLYVFWSFASARWSGAPDIAIAGSALLAIQVLWALALGNGVGAVGVRYVVRALLGVTLLTSLVAIWYYYGRNPTLRAKFPFGNPTFLSACLIPGITLAGAGIVHALRGRREGSIPSWIWAAVAAITAAAGLWAFALTNSRGAQVGLGAAFLATAFFALRGRWRLLPVVLGAGLACVAFVFYAETAKSSRAGRGESLRLRGYAWNYALRMFYDRPVTGHGQGGYALLGDSFVVEDVLDDPAVFDGPLDHAHNEWLEVLADLGGVGGVLVGGALILTLFGVAFAWRGHGEDRLLLAGLGGALVGMIIEESAGVGLRVSEVPVAFYTVLGLTWAAGRDDQKIFAWVQRSPLRGWGMGLAALGLAFGAFALNQFDFRSARRAYEIQQRLAQNKAEDAAALAELGLWRLSPQRALSGRFQTADSYIRFSEQLIHRATQRDQKARTSEPPDSRVLTLAQMDMAQADEALKLGGHALKQLIERSPAFFNSGVLDYRMNLVRAQAAFLRQDREGSEASRKNAVAALERELQRQPFRSQLANEYARFARPEASLAKVLMVLGRPLRFEPVTDETAGTLQELAQLPEALTVLGRSLEAAALGAAAPPGNGLIDARWSPEVARMIAAIDFMRGEYERAEANLALAAELYGAMPRPATLGEAAAHVEWADAVLYADPEKPEAALAIAAKAVELAPHSRLGRELQAIARQRMVQYELAAGREEEASRLLKTILPPSTSKQVFERELGTRLRKLTQSILLRRAALILRKPADTLFPKMQRWIQRSLELNPQDYAAHYIAADLALHAGDDTGAAGHIRAALELGLQPADAARFVQMALEQHPDSAALRTLAAELGAVDLASDRKEP